MPPRPKPRRWRRAFSSLRRRARWVAPALLVVAGCGAFVLGGTPSGEEFFAAAEARALAASAALGLVVNNIEVEGRTTTDAAMIMAALHATRGTPILAVSPNRAQRQLERLPWVRSAVIERRLPDTLYVRLVERRPLAIWQHAGKQQLIDHEGEVIPVTDLARFSRLPMVVGEGAAKRAAALIDMLSRQPKLAARVTAAVLVDDRRWNLRIDNAVEVMLPEEDAAAAWARLQTLENSEKVFERDIQSVDLRLPDRLVLRVTGPAGQPEVPGKEGGAPKKTHAPGKST